MPGAGKLSSVNPMAHAFVLAWRRVDVSAKERERRADKRTGWLRGCYERAHIGQSYRAYLSAQSHRKKDHQDENHPTHDPVKFIVPHLAGPQVGVIPYEEGLRIYQRALAKAAASPAVERRYYLVLKYVVGGTPVVEVSHTHNPGDYINQSRVKAREQYRQHLVVMLWSVGTSNKDCVALESHVDARIKSAFLYADFPRARLLVRSILRDLNLSPEAERRWGWNGVP